MTENVRETRVPTPAEVLAWISMQLVSATDDADRARWRVLLGAMWDADAPADKHGIGDSPQWTIVQLRTALENWGRHHSWCDRISKSWPCGAANGRRGRCPNRATNSFQNTHIVRGKPIKATLYRCSEHPLRAEELGTPLPSVQACSCGYEKALELGLFAMALPLVEIISQRSGRREDVSEKASER